MTTIVNLPSLTTLTNALVFVAADTSDNDKTKKVSLSQLVALSAGPRGPAGIAGVQGPSGPSGPSGPNADQSLNTSSSVSFESVSISTAISFSDGTQQTTAYKKTIQELSGFSIGNVSLTSNQITASLLTGNPTAAGRNLYLPTAGIDLEGTILVIRNRSTTYTFDVWGGVVNLATVSSPGAVQIACDGSSWFVV
jgi:hypothetical protein